MIQKSNKFVPVKGFTGYGLHSGVKKAKKDICLIYSEDGATCGSVYTQNIYKAAPIIVSKENIEASEKIHALLVNSGNANACTGIEGMENCNRKMDILSKKLNILKNQVVISSTGIIGKQLEMDKIIPAIDNLIENMSLEGLSLCPESICTTDTFEKTATVVYSDDSENTITLSGFSKGSGMIHPNMATMLCFVLTDASITKELLQKAVSEVSADTFNMISVDGDTSTNDMATTLASGKSKAKAITDENSKEYKQFKNALFAVYKDLAVLIAKDGEGASKLIEINVSNASTKENARLLARSVSSSNLLKAALFGNDANWGRTVCAMGYSGAEFDPNVVDIRFSSVGGSMEVLKNGQPIVFDEELALKILNTDKVIIDIDMKSGDCSATAWGCDLTYEYVKINGEYRS